MITTTFKIRIYDFLRIEQNMLKETSCLFIDLIIHLLLCTCMSIYCKQDPLDGNELCQAPNLNCCTRNHYRT